MIKNCKIHGLTEFSISNRPRCRKCIVIAVQKRRSKIKLLAVEYKGGKCEQCGYNKCLGALSFHHLDPTKKSFAIGNKGHTRSWKLVQAELDKCELLCANCHAEKHWWVT